MKANGVKAYSILEKVRNKRPIIHHLTNWVTIYDCANVVKVLGASPVMAHAPEEVAEMAGIASALVLNIGTLTPDFVESMKLAAKAANKKGIPIVLDVCGCGATGLRDKKTRELLDEVRIDIIKGNASEIARVGGLAATTKGVDAGEVKGDLTVLARRIAQERSCTVVITGKEDIVTDGKKICVVKNGDAMMASIVGTGCMASSVIGTFAAIEKDFAYAAAAGLACFEIAAEIAAATSNGPGTFKEKLFDELFHLNKMIVEKRQRIYFI